MSYDNALRETLLTNKWLALWIMVSGCVYVLQGNES
jgi:hypothetical protein